MIIDLGSYQLPRTITVRPMQPTRVIVAIMATTAALFAISGPAGADSDRIVRLAHGPVTATVIDGGVAGNSAGDLRTYHIALTKPRESKRIGFMTGSLLTTAIDKPRKGWDQRTADLVFTVRGAPNQLIVGGVASYRQKAATLSRSESVIRPVIGGSGRYAGAKGWCESIHRANDTWRHVFHISVR